MSHIEIPNPILDAKELFLDERLVRDYEKFSKPGFIGTKVNQASAAISKRIPSKLKKFAGKAVSKISEVELIQNAVKYAGEGFSELSKHGAKLTISKKYIVESVKRRGSEIEDFHQIPFARSYQIEAAVERAKLRRLLYATAEGAATGAFGALGIPFNIAFSFFLFFRSTQAVAMTYGYDLENDPSELAIASEVTLNSLEPRLFAADGGIEASLTKLMMTSELSSLGSALAKGISFGKMIENGGLQSLFVQIRAFGHASAQKALEKSGQKTLEAGFFKGILEKVGEKATKEAAAKSIPYISALFGAGIDTLLMNRVLKGANLFYHKRFLAEKALRIKFFTESQK